MIVLYDQSESFGGLVIGTSNKTEILLGYSTIFGDSAAAINPIGDLYKTQVRQLSRAMGVPNEIIDKAPSADLWANQTDEDELGITYEKLDEILYNLYELNIDKREITGFSDEEVEKTIKMFKNSEFKRRMPPIPRMN